MNNGSTGWKGFLQWIPVALASNLPGLSSITPTPCCLSGAAAHSIKCFTRGTFPPDREPQAIELVFTEIYVDSLIEVHRRSGVAAFLTGRFPGRVPLTNPRALHIWNGNLRLMFSANEQRVVDRVIAQEG